MSTVLFWAGIAAMALGTLGGWVPLWKSATLSPDSIQRRVYWFCSAVVVLLGFTSQLPYLLGALFVGASSALALVCIAFYWTNHLKLNGRIFAAFAHNRRPDRPPALRDHAEE